MMSLEQVVLPENNEVNKEWWRHVKRTQEPACQSFHRANILTSIKITKMNGNASGMFESKHSKWYWKKITGHCGRILRNNSLFWKLEDKGKNNAFILLFLHELYLRAQKSWWEEVSFYTRITANEEEWEEWYSQGKEASAFDAPAWGQRLEKRELLCKPQWINGSRKWSSVATNIAKEKRQLMKKHNTSC